MKPLTTEDIKKRAELEAKAEVLDRFQGCLFAFASMPVLIALRGWVLSVVWNWFMPLIFGMKTIRVVEALGLSLVITLFTNPIRPTSDKTPELTFKRVWIDNSVSAAGYALVLFMGYLFHYGLTH